MPLTAGDIAPVRAFAVTDERLLSIRAFSHKDKIVLEYDHERRTMAFSVNGTAQGRAYTVDAKTKPLHLIAGVLPSALRRLVHFEQLLRGQVDL